jgi:hypothetical protein
MEGTLMSTKITGLTRDNVAALNLTVGGDHNFILLTKTTAIFSCPPQEALTRMQEVVASLPGRQYPKAALHAVVRKLRAEVLNGRQPVPSEPVAE